MSIEMTAPLSVSVEWKIPLTEPREFTYGPTGETRVGICVRWWAFVVPGGWRGVTSVTMFSADSYNTEIAYDVSDGYEVPDWVPRPPDGWDATIVALRAEHFPKEDA